MCEYDHLKQIEKQTGKTPRELQELPEFPEELSYVLYVFQKMSKQRQVGFNGPLSLSYQEMESFIRLTGTRVSRREVEAITELDRSYLEGLNGK